MSESISTWQQLIDKFVQERGWKRANVYETYFLFQEEIGELTKAMRTRTKFHLEQKEEAPVDNLEEEFADVLMYLIDLANYFNIDLDQAMKNKIEKNQSRIWN